MIGTAAHWVLENALEFSLPVGHFLGMTAPNDIEIDLEIIENVQFAVDWVLENIDGELVVESRADIYKALEPRLPIPAIYGTVDIRIYGDGDVLTIADYKNGVWGVPVSNNPQLELYALGALHDVDYRYDKVRMVIIQPRNGGIKSVEVETDYLLRKELYYRSAIAAGLSQTAEANPSENNCRFCPAKFKCKDYWDLKNTELLDMMVPK